jgi:hypothetical protein
MSSRGTCLKTTNAFAYEAIFAKRDIRVFFLLRHNLRMGKLEVNAAGRIQGQYLRLHRSAH